MALKAFCLSREFTTLCTRLDLAPCLEWQVAHRVHHGLSGRVFTRQGVGNHPPLTSKGKRIATLDDNNYYDVCQNPRVFAIIRAKLLIVK
jgi:hypothetical protein